MAIAAAIICGREKFIACNQLHNSPDDLMNAYLP
jgi:hypothetical protein